MTIIHEETIFTFGDLHPGQAFRHDDDFYMKMGQRDAHDFNAVRLTDGMCARFKGYAEVVPMTAKVYMSEGE